MIIPFPQHRRVGFIRELAKRSRPMSVQATEIFLADAINKVAGALVKAGVDRDRANKETVKLRAAISAAEWKLIDADIQNRRWQL